MPTMKNRVKRLFPALAFAAALSVLVAPFAAFAVSWDFPRTGSCHEGIAFADGVTGVLVWGGGDIINMTVGRSDLWDHRGGYPWLPEQSYTNIVAAVQCGDKNRLYGLFNKVTPEGEPRNPYMLPLGRVVIKVPGKTLVSGSLDPFSGLGDLVFEDGGRVEMAMSKSSHAFAMCFPSGVTYEVRTVPATSFPVYERDLKGLQFEKAKVVDLDGTGVGGLRWKLPADKGVWLSWTRKGADFSLMTGRGVDCVFADSRPFGMFAMESVAYWTQFWREGARVSVPDPAIQEAFDYGMYRFGAMTDPDGVPAGLQGPWLEDDRLVPWNGDYHFNINVQECYSPAYRGGHFRNLMPLFRMVLSWRPLLRENAQKFAGIDDGYVLPHSVDDRGVCIGGFWTGTIDHASTAWVAAMMFRYVKYSGDVAFLRGGAYDFMKGAMNVYLAMMEERDGRLSIPIAPSPEWGAADVRKAVGRDPSFQLAAAHRLARDLVSAAALVGDGPDPRWIDVEKRLPGWTQGPGGMQLFEGQPFVESHRHHSHMAGLYPFDTVAGADGSSPQVVFETYNTWVEKGTGLWSGWCVPWASILHTHMGNADAAVHAILSWRTFYNNPGHGSLHDAFRKGFTLLTGRPTIMQMDGQCAAVTAIMEMMAHEVGGKVEFFRGCPDSWKEVSFENLALSDGTRVSGSRVNGKVNVERVGNAR